MPIKNRQAQASRPVTGKTLTGKTSWFGGPQDSSDSGHTASGVTTAVPGIAVYDESTLGGYWLLTLHANNQTKLVKQTDIGPAPWTGRVVDLTYSLLRHFGFTTSNYPTDSTATLTYLGKDRNGAIAAAGGNTVIAGGAGSSPVDPSSDGSVAGGGGGTMQDASLVGGAEDVLSILKDLVTGNIGDLGEKLGLMALQLTKNVAVGFVDLIVAPAWHWNQRTVAYYSQVVLDPRNVADRGDYQWALGWTAAFWAAGYVLLYTEDESQGGKGMLKPVPVHRSRLGRHVRRAQALPARRSLIKPKDVRERTPKKPQPHTTSVVIVRVGTMTTTRPRPVRVTREDHGRADTAAPTTSGTPIERERPAHVPSEEAHAERHAEPHKVDNGGAGARQDSGGRSQGPTGSGSA